MRRATDQNTILLVFTSFYLAAGRPLPTPSAYQPIRKGLGLSQAQNNSLPEMTNVMPKSRKYLHLPYKQRPGRPRLRFLKCPLVRRIATAQSYTLQNARHGVVSPWAKHASHVPRMMAPSEDTFAILVLGPSDASIMHQRAPSRLVSLSSLEARNQTSAYALYPAACMIPNSETPLLQSITVSPTYNLAAPRGVYTSFEASGSPGDPDRLDTSELSMPCASQRLLYIAPTARTQAPLSPGTTILQFDTDTACVPALFASPHKDELRAHTCTQRATILSSTAQSAPANLNPKRAPCHGQYRLVLSVISVALIGMGVASGPRRFRRPAGADYPIPRRANACSRSHFLSYMHAQSGRPESDPQADPKPELRRSTLAISASFFRGEEVSPLIPGGALCSFLAMQCACAANMHRTQRTHALEEGAQRSQMHTASSAGPGRGMAAFLIAHPVAQARAALQQFASGRFILVYFRAPSAYPAMQAALASTIHAYSGGLLIAGDIELRTLARGLCTSRKSEDNGCWRDQRTRNFRSGCFWICLGSGNAAPSIPLQSNLTSYEPLVLGSGYIMFKIECNSAKFILLRRIRSPTRHRPSNLPGLSEIISKTGLYCNQLKRRTEFTHAGRNSRDSSCTPTPRLGLPPGSAGIGVPHRSSRPRLPDVPMPAWALYTLLAGHSAICDMRSELRGLCRLEHHRSRRQARCLATMKASGARVLHLHRYPWGTNRDPLHEHSGTSTLDAGVREARLVTSVSNSVAPPASGCIVASLADSGDAASSGFALSVVVTAPLCLRQISHFKNPAVPGPGPGAQPVQVSATVTAPPTLFARGALDLPYPTSFEHPRTADAAVLQPARRTDLNSILSTVTLADCPVSIAPPSTCLRSCAVIPRPAHDVSVAVFTRLPLLPVLTVGLIASPLPDPSHTSPNTVYLHGHHCTMYINPNITWPTVHQITPYSLPGRLSSVSTVQTGARVDLTPAPASM
ncbi:hypothetical protein EVG20_g2054 [Dentipellis fragilis]|uniref:Uncharacterized protein n=1 Tax=Dentipellis fragilis TaxID=205917 RepID=A0A4Y9Z8T5_9AGAM|nr:hypothetical protein EVG20_g2054 [Dentipellis fragilis]